MTTFTGHFHPGAIAPVVSRAPYRDYLRRIATTDPKAPGSAEEATGSQALRERLHQDFSGGDELPSPANALVIGVLSEALTAPPPLGFGIDPARLDPDQDPTAAAYDGGILAPRDYLDHLIGLSGVTPVELHRRLQIDLTRTDNATTSPVEENIAALLGFFRDVTDAGAQPATSTAGPIDGFFTGPPPAMAPFFLEYDEWLRSLEPPFPANSYQLRAARVIEPAYGFSNDRYETDLEQLGIQAKMAQHIVANEAYQNGPQDTWTFHDDESVWVLAIIDADNLCQKAHGLYAAGEFTAAQDAYSAALQRLKMAPFPTDERSFGNSTLLADHGQRRLAPIHAEIIYTTNSQGADNTFNLSDVNQASRYFQSVAIPLWLGDCAAALGQWTAAVGWYNAAIPFAVGHAQQDDPAGWSYDPTYQLFATYRDGSLPYTTLYSESGSDVWKTLSADEREYLRLRYGTALLGWAEVLYRADDGASVARARELYKGVLALHDQPAPLAPDWTGGSGATGNPSGGGGGVGPVPQISPNPAVTLQLTQARLALQQIALGLNAYGLTDEFIPPQRYASLREAALRVVAEARMAEQDFLMAQQQIEAEVIEQLKLRNMRQHALAQQQIAHEQQAVAHDNAVQAQAQLDALQHQIAQAQQDLDDKDSFWSQLSDYASGMSSAVGTASTAVGTEQSVANAGGYTTLTEQLGLTAGEGAALGGAGFLGGFGAFVAMSYVTLSSMADAANKRQTNLNFLVDHALPAAIATVDARKHEIAIAQLQGQIADADLQLVTALTDFARDAVLNLDFWAALAQIRQRQLRRYLDLGGRLAWLAERALSYQIDVPTRTIRLDYFPAVELGVSGAETLQADLEELEAARIAAQRVSAPITHTVSLAREHPLAFGALKHIGRAVFYPSATDLRAAYPGMYRHRVKAVSVLPTTTKIGPPPRGMLSNIGVSMIDNERGEPQVSIRPADAMPISGFAIRRDLEVFALPGDTLMPFEGSGYASAWRVVLPTAANPQGLQNLSDVLVTFDLSAVYSPSLHAAQDGAADELLNRGLVVFASAADPKTLASLETKGGQADVHFDLTALPLPHETQAATIGNLFVIVVADQPPATLTIAAGHPPVTAPATLASGAAFSDGPPLPPQATPSPLRQLIGHPLRTVITVGLSVPATAGLHDVLLGVDFTIATKP